MGLELGLVLESGLEIKFRDSQCGNSAYLLIEIDNPAFWIEYG
jgi:hypothetical protein